MSHRFVQNASRGVGFKHDIFAAIRNARAVDIAVSYLQMSGWFMLWHVLKRVPSERVRLLTTDQLNITQPAVLKMALDSGVQLRCYRGNRTYHPKVYLVHGVSKSNDIVILGSANISGSGLRGGIEAGIRISDTLLFKRMVQWFEELFGGTAARKVDEKFIRDYHRRWKRAAQARVPIQRVPNASKKSRVAPEELVTLDDAFSTITLPIGTLGFDQAGNNIRNLSRLMTVLARYPKIGAKERSELHLLGLMERDNLSILGKKMKRCRTMAAASKIWTSWIKRTPDTELMTLNPRLRSFKRAARRFWRLKSEVRNFFLLQITNPEERETLQAIELCCNGSEVVEALSMSDFRAMATSILRRKGLTEFIKLTVKNYLDNKGSRSWTGDDRRVVLTSYR